jgi:hypothetical protein
MDRLARYIEVIILLLGMSFAAGAGRDAPCVFSYFYASAFLIIV